MKLSYRLAGYLVAAALLIGLMSMSPQAWATPGQTQGAQTIPTRTPKPPTAQPGPTSPPPTSRPATSLPPTSPPQPTTSPSPTVSPATGTPALESTPTPAAATPTAIGTTPPGLNADALGLTIEVNQSQIWRGAAVLYTVTLVNRSGSTLRNIVLVSVLPIGLEPGEARSGASWQGRTLRAEKDELAAGAQIQFIFQTFVGDSAPAGAVISSDIRASALGVPEVAASVSAAMPPAELPRVGGS